MLGALASSLKLTFGSSEKSTQSLLPTSPSDGSPKDYGSILSGRKDGGAAAVHGEWWAADTVFLVTEAPDPKDPASASPVLIRTTHGEVLAVFEVLPPSPHATCISMAPPPTKAHRLPTCNLSEARSCVRTFADRSMCSCAI